MGATAALEFAIRHPGKALSLTIAAAGGGGSSDPGRQAPGSSRSARPSPSASSARACRPWPSSTAPVPRACTYRDKDPRGWAEFKQQFADGSAKGHAMTMRGMQGARQPFFERTAELQTIPVPMLVIIGDEDDSTHGLAVHLKTHVPRCGVLDAAQDRPHASTSEEPAAFNAARAGLPPRRRARPLARARRGAAALHAGSARQVTGSSRQGRRRPALRHSTYLAGSAVILTFSGRTCFSRSV